MELVKSQRLVEIISRLNRIYGNIPSELPCLTVLPLADHYRVRCTYKKKN